MHYNTKIIEYPNGEIQIRKYSNLMYLNPKNTEDMTDEERAAIKLRNDMKRNPFDNYITSEFVTVEELEERQLSNKYRSLNRTKQSVYTYARCFAWDWFVTFTFSGSKIDRYNYQECSRAVRKWLNNQKRTSPKLKYIIVPEQHKDGAWHFHGLLADVGEMVFVDSGKKDKGEIIYNLEKYKYGFTTATKVKDMHRVAKYIGKYIIKSVMDSLPGRNRYFVSTNLPRPVQKLYFLEDDEVNDFVDIVAESCGKKIAHVSQTQAIENYTQCRYIELQ